MFIFLAQGAAAVPQFINQPFSPLTFFTLNKYLQFCGGLDAVAFPFLPSNVVTPLTNRPNLLLLIVWQLAPWMFASVYACRNSWGRPDFSPEADPTIKSSDSSLALNMGRLKLPTPPRLCSTMAVLLHQDDDDDDDEAPVLPPPLHPMHRLQCTNNHKFPVRKH